VARQKSAKKETASYGNAEGDMGIFHGSVMRIVISVYGRISGACKSLAGFAGEMSSDVSRSLRSIVARRIAH
jgi:hypothetical protein